MHRLPEFSFAILDYVGVINNVVTIIGDSLIRLSLPEFLRVFIYILFRPIFVLFEVLANFKVDFTALNVTCAGAQVRALVNFIFYFTFFLCSTCSHFLPPLTRAHIFFQTQAPLELTVNMIILGIVIVVIQSEYQVSHPRKFLVPVRVSFLIYFFPV